MVYVCSDLHGYPIEKFLELLQSVNFSKQDTLYVLGDVIDRGDDGIKLLKWMMSQQNVTLLRGNHEAMLLENEFWIESFEDNGIDRVTYTKVRRLSDWKNNGGDTTLHALSTMGSSEIRYLLKYLSQTPLYKTLNVNGRDFLLVHSGLGNFSKEKKLSEYSEGELLWTRPILDENYFQDITTVFGHTPTVLYGEMYRGKIIRTETWVDIDVGAGMGIPPALLRLEDMKVFYGKSEERV